MQSGSFSFIMIDIYLKYSHSFSFAWGSDFCFPVSISSGWFSDYGRNSVRPSLQYLSHSCRARVDVRSPVEPLDLLPGVFLHNCCWPFGSNFLSTILQVFVRSPGFCILRRFNTLIGPRGIPLSIWTPVLVLECSFASTTPSFAHSYRIRFATTRVSQALVRWFAKDTWEIPPQSSPNFRESWSGGPFLDFVDTCDQSGSTTSPDIHWVELSSGCTRQQVLLIFLARFFIWYAPVWRALPSRSSTLVSEPTTMLPLSGASWAQDPRKFLRL